MKTALTAANVVNRVITLATALIAFSLTPMRPSTAAVPPSQAAVQLESSVSVAAIGNGRADSLLAVDMSRTEIVERLMLQWQSEISAAQAGSLKAKLFALRADRLLAASLVGSFDGLLSVLLGQEQGDRPSATATSKLGASHSKALGDAAQDLAYTPITPCRIVDTRPSQGGTGPISGGASKDFLGSNAGSNFAAQGGNAGSDCGIPNSAVAIAFVGTVVLNSAPGYMTVWPTGQAMPTSVLTNYLASGMIISNTAIVPLGTGRKFSAFSTATTDFAADAVGYFSTPTAVAESLKTSFLPPYATWRKTALAIDSNEGDFVATTTGADGMPLIAYNNLATNALTLAKCDDISCLTKTVTTVDAAGADFISITTGAFGFPMIAYQDVAAALLKVAQCTNATCSTKNIRTIDNTGNVGRFTAIAVPEDGRPVIAYRDHANFALKLARCNDAQCSGAATLTNLGGSAAAPQGQGLSMALNGSTAYIVHNNNGNLEMVSCPASSCGTPTRTTIVPGVATTGSNIVIAPSGTPYIAFSSSSGTTLARCLDAVCSTTLNVSNISTTSATHLGLVMVGDGTAMFAMVGGSSSAAMTTRKCKDQACSSTETRALAASGTQTAVAMTVTPDGYPFIAFRNSVTTQIEAFKLLPPR